jgi:hypothetical protein
MEIDMILVKEDFRLLGLNWQGAFLNRHPELKSKFIPL